MTAAPDWSPESWRARPALHQPAWPDPAERDQVTKALRDLPPLVFAGEARSLTEHLGRVAAGEAIVLQAGDCAESFDSSADSIRDRLRVILQIAIVLTYSGGMPVVKVGRIAGQFAKPRSSPTETVGGTELPSFLGHMVNDIGFTDAERAHDPSRLLTAYHRAASTLNLLRAFTRGGYADPGPGVELEPGVRGLQPGRPALPGHGRRDRPGPAVHDRLRHHRRGGAPDPRGGAVHQP